MQKINSLVSYLDAHRGRCVIALFILHCLVSSTMYGIANTSLLANMHNGHGFWNFAPDAIGYHQAAIELADALRSGDIEHWWKGYESWKNVKLIAVVYALTKPSPAFYSPVNAAIWISSLCLVFFSARLILNETKHAYVVALIFGFMPSYFLTTTTLLRDPLFVLGICLLMYGWISLILGRHPFYSVACLVVGMQLMGAMRGYLIPIPLIILTFSLLILLFLKPYALRKPALAALSLVWVLNIGNISPPPAGEVAPPPAGEVAPPPAGEVAPPPAGEVANIFLDYITLPARWFNTARQGFISDHPKAASNIDVSIHFNHLRDVVFYLPRALQIGFLAPFPEHWVAKAGQAGNMARLVAGVEMIIWYLILAGFIVSTMCCDKRALMLLLPMILLSLIVILLLGLCVPNLGALYRMRFGFLIPFIILGVNGFDLILNRSKSFVLHLKNS